CLVVNISSCPETESGKAFKRCICERKSLSAEEGQERTVVQCTYFVKTMDTSAMSDQKEKPKFTPPVARGTQNEGKRKCQKEEKIKKTKEKKERRNIAVGTEMHEAPGPKDFVEGELVEGLEKSKLGNDKSSAGVETKQLQAVKSELEEVCATESKSGKLNKEGRKKTKFIETEENAEAVGSGDSQKEGMGESEQGEHKEKRLGEKKPPLLSGVAGIAASKEEKRKEKKKGEDLDIDLRAEVQMEKGVKKKKRSEKSMAKGKRRDLEKRSGDSMNSKQEARQSSVVGPGKSEHTPSMTSPLSDSQYNDIFESVLDSSLEYCLVPQYSDCDCPEENWSGSEGELVHSNLVPGSLVWAQQPGFPWWPAMIEINPDSKSSFLFSNKKDKSPSKYHVTYFGEPVTRAWVSACRVKVLQSLSEETALNAVKQQSYKKMLNEAICMTKEAEKLPLKRRLAQFGFLKRYCKNKEHSVAHDRDNAERRKECSGDEEYFSGTPQKKRRKKEGKTDASKKGEKSGKKKKGETRGQKVTTMLFTGPKGKKASGKPELAAGEALSHGKELTEGEGGAVKKALIPSFMSPKDKKAKDRQAPEEMEKPQPKARDQTVPDIPSYSGLEGGEVEREGDLGSAREDREAREIKREEQEVKRGVKKEESDQEVKSEIKQELKREALKEEVSVTKEEGKESSREREMKVGCEGEDLGMEMKCMKQKESSVALEEEPGFLENDIEILNCRQEILKCVRAEEEDSDEDFNFMLFMEE
ncbi:hypothetical protein JZ751_006740, partial [Albula glossodonta]